MANENGTVVKSKRYSWWIVVVSLWLVVLLVVGAGGEISSTQEVLASEGDGPSSQFLPLVMHNHPEPLSLFGVEINAGKVSSTVSKAADAHVQWVRYNGIKWHHVEATRGVRDWSALERLESDLRILNRKGFTPMVIIRGTPDWAQKIPGLYCGPIRQDALDDFASFVGEVVQRYSAPPYNVKYWEILNEPDAYIQVPPTSGYGCWGDENDPLGYYGGRTYAQMLKKVYPAIKQADPSATVVLGGLLMGCDADDPTPQPGIGSCPSSFFLEGILVEGGASAFDLLAYHAYPYWYGQKNVDWDLRHSHWDHRGGVLLGKLDFIDETLAKFGVSKPIIMNEGGLMCGWNETDVVNYSRCLTDQFRVDQANAALRLYIRTGATKVLGSAWYTLNGPGWREGGLLDEDQNARPAYTTYRFIGTLLDGASYSRQLASGTLEGYAFTNRQGGKEYQFYWTNDDSKVPVTFPAGTIGVYNLFGQKINIAPGSTSIDVGFEPIMIELTGS